MRRPRQSAQRSTTIYAVAEAAGCSTATVSRVLSGSDKVAPATREAVMAAVHALNYLPDASARALAGRRTQSLGLVLPHIDGPYYASLLVGFEMAASARDRSVVICLAKPGADSRAALWKLAGAVDGMAFMARSGADDETIRELSRRRPVVTVARPQVDGLPAFAAENRLLAAELTAHLIEKGRRRLAFVGLHEPVGDLGERYLGFRDALADAGLDEAAQFEVDPLESEGLAVAARVLDLAQQIDALVCANDELALAIMTSLQDSGIRVPEDIAIVGWDDTLAARYVRPGLTTVAQPAARLAALAADTLIELIESDGDDQGGAEDGAPATQAAPATVLPARIVHRSSCGC